MMDYQKIRLFAKAWYDCDEITAEQKRRIREALERLSEVGIEVKFPERRFSVGFRPEIDAWVVFNRGKPAVTFHSQGFPGVAAHWAERMADDLEELS